MASAFGHACLAGAMGFHLKNQDKFKLIVLGMLSSALPDLDIIAFNFGIPYTHMFGHREFTHSIFFAIIWSFLVQQMIFKVSEQKWKIWIYLFLCTISHGILDAMTTGGRGIAFFAPFSAERYFFPWRVIQVSPLSASDFFGEWGLKVIQSEIYWIGLPSLLIITIPWIFHFIKKMAVR